MFKFSTLARTTSSHTSCRFFIHFFFFNAEMTVTTPLYSMVNRLGQLVQQDTATPSAQTHFELLRMIDQIKLAVESPSETVQRLIYQVWCALIRNDSGYSI